MEADEDYNLGSSQSLWWPMGSNRSKNLPQTSYCPPQTNAVSCPVLVEATKIWGTNIQGQLPHNQHSWSCRRRGLKDEMGCVRGSGQKTDEVDYCSVWYEWAHQRFSYLGISQTSIVPTPFTIPFAWILACLVFPLSRCSFDWYSMPTSTSKRVKSAADMVGNWHMPGYRHLTWMNHTECALSEIWGFFLIEAESLVFRIAEFSFPVTFSILRYCSSSEEVAMSSSVLYGIGDFETVTNMGVLQQWNSQGKFSVLKGWRDGIQKAVSIGARDEKVINPIASFDLIS